MSSSLMEASSSRPAGRPLAGAADPLARPGAHCVMGLLSAPVGKDCANKKQDVRIVEYLLNRAMTRIYPPTASTGADGKVSFEAAVIRAIPVDGKIDDGVIQAINDFQRNVLGFKYPDSRIDPGKNTIKELARNFAAQGGVIAVSPDEAKRLVKPNSMYNQKTGPLYQTGIVRAGELVAGFDGTRAVLAISSRETIFMLLDKDGPGSELADMNPMRGRVGTVYRQSTEAFLDERNGMFFHGLAKRLQPVKALIELEMGIILAVVSGTSMPGFIVVTGVSGLQFIAENREKFPKWASAVSTVLSVRKTLKTYAPTLYDKMIDGLFEGAKRAAASAVGYAGPDVVSNVPDAMAKDPMTTGKLIGALIAGLGKAGVAKRLTLFGVVFTILKTLATKAVMAVPGAIGITAQEKIKAAKDIVAQLQAAGVLITEEEARQIVEEVQRNAHKVKPALEDLARAFQDLR